MVNIIRRETILKDLRRKFIYADNALSAMTLSVEFGLASLEEAKTKLRKDRTIKPKHAIFYGKGGFGKSEMAKAVFDSYGIKPPNFNKDGSLSEDSLDADKHLFVKALSSGTQIEDLLGGIDMPLMQKEGKIEYLLENSFMNYPFVILEEALDCPPAILTALKDILTEGSYRGGNQYFESKVQCIMILTNRTPQEYAEDASIAALMERFPLGCEVGWSSMELKDYRKLYQTVFASDWKENEEYYTLTAELISDTNGKAPLNQRISPRSAVWFAEVLRNTGWNLAEAINIRGVDPTKILAKSAAILAKLNERKIWKEIEQSATEFLSLGDYIKNLPTEKELEADFKENGEISKKFIKNRNIFNEVSSKLEQLGSSSDTEIQKKILEYATLKRDVHLAMAGLNRKLDSLFAAKMAAEL